MKWFLGALGALFFLVGCGGSNSGTINVFQGSWTGPWTAGADTGTATFRITGINSVAGTITDSTTGQVYQVSGSLSNPSSHSTSVTLTEANSGNNVIFSGIITQNATFSSFSGTLTDIASSGVTQTISLSLTQTV